MRLACKKTWVSSVLTIVFLVSFSGAALGARWEIVETENFVMVGETGSKELRRIATELERLRQTLSSLMPESRTKQSLPVRVMVFKDLGSYRKVNPEAERLVIGNLMEGDPAYIVFVGKLARGRRSLHPLLLGGYTKFFFALNLGYVPFWLETGLWEYYGTTDFRDGGQEVRVGDPSQLEILSLRTRRFFSLSRLFSIRPHSREYDPNDNSTVFSAQSAALTHYLLSHPEYLTKIPQFLHALQLGIPSESSFQSVFGDLRTFEEKLSKYVHSVTFPIQQIKFAQAVQFKQGDRSRFLEEDEVEFFKGELLERLDFYDRAESYFQESLKSNENNSDSLVALAQLRMREANYASAQELLEKAGKLSPNRYELHLTAGRLWRYLNDLEKAAGHYQRAAELRPGDARPHREIELIRLEQGLEQEAALASDRALQLDPYDLKGYYRRAFLFLRLKEGARAASQAAIFLRRHRWTNKDSFYVSLALHFAHLQQGNFEKAEELLQQHRKQMREEDWPSPVFAYLSQEITGDELLERASEDNQKMTEARTYLGLNLLYRSQIDQAKIHLKWVKNQGNRASVNYRIVVAELSRLEK